MKEHLKLERKLLFIISVMIAFACIIPIQAQKVTLETHQDLGQEALWFWYRDSKKPTHVFNRNISPKGDCIQVVNGYVFITWYKGGMTKRNLMLSRLQIATNEWSHIEFPDKNSLYNGRRDGKDVTGAGNSHRTTSVGVSAIDGTVHLAYDMHAGALNYRVSNKNIAFAPKEKFKASNFSGKRDYFRKGERIANFTYPSFEVNNKGELMVEYRRGHSRQGDKYLVFYDGNQWSKTQLIIRGNNENPEFNQYGGLTNYFGKMYLGCAVRIKNSNTQFNQGFFFAEAGPRGTENWKNIKGESFKVPIKGLSTMNKFKVASPLPKGHKGMTAAPKMVVSKNGAVHMTNFVKGTGTVHYYSSPGGKTMKKASGSSPDVSFPGDDGRVYSIGLSNGKIQLRSTPEGQSNWRTDYTWNGSEKFGLMEYDYQDGKVYIIASEKVSSDKLPLHYFVINLGGGSTNTPNKAPQVSFKSPSKDFSVEEDYALSLEVNASDADGSISTVDLYIDDELVRQEKSAPYQWGQGKTANELNGRKAGTYTIKAVATDDKGKSSETSITMTVNGDNPPNNKAPQVSFVDPSGNITVNEGYKLAIKANAKDADGSISNVKLYIDDQLIRQENEAPYNWGRANELNGRKAGVYTVKAVATDDKGATGETSFKFTVGQNTDPDPDPKPDSTCDFGTPRSSGIPALDKVIYNNVSVVGSGGPSLSNFRRFTINWNPGYNGIYQFAINTNNGAPDWYVDFKENVTFQLKNKNPEVSLKNTGFKGLDGDYWVNVTDDSFILVSKKGNFSIHFSKNSKKPTCGNKNSDQLSENVLFVEQNPFTDILTISGLTGNETGLMLYNVQGKQILNMGIPSGASTVSLETGTLAKGVYFAKVISPLDNNLKTMKVIKN